MRTQVGRVSESGATRATRATNEVENLATCGLAEDLDTFADLIAERVVALLDARKPRQDAPNLVDSATLATALGVSRHYVYANADRLGGVRLGTGKRPRLRFDLAAAIAAHTTTRANPEPDRQAPPKPTRHRRARVTSDVELLPIRGRAA